MTDFVVAAIPSPASGHIGPLRAYGMLIAIGVLVATQIAERRWRARGNPPGGILDLAFWIIVAGVVGARLYHVATDYQRFDDAPWRALAIWQGGLSIWGAVIGGAIAVLVQTRRTRVDPLVVMDCIVPGLLAAQAIGRWGNWFNQELFGKPTALPWALEIAAEHRPAGYAMYSTFHPTFLYESLYALVLIAVILWAERRFRFRRGETFALYVMLYTFGRFWLENLRIDPAHHIGPLRVNAWVSLIVFVLGAAWFTRLRTRPATCASVAQPSRPADEPAGADG